MSQTNNGQPNNGKPAKAPQRNFSTRPTKITLVPEDKLPKAQAIPDVRRGRHNQITPLNLQAALYEAQGSVSRAALILTINHSSIYKLLTAWPELEMWRQEQIELRRNGTLDKAEDFLEQQIDQGNFLAAKFYLERQGKDRGWAPRTELSGPDGAAIKVAALPPQPDTLEAYCEMYSIELTHDE